MSNSQMISRTLTLIAMAVVSATLFALAFAPATPLFAG